MGVKVLIVGAGIVGAACARSLAHRGAAVTVVDRGAPASATSAAGEGNLLVSDKGPGPELDLARYSLALWRSMGAQLVAEIGASFPSIEYQLKGGVVVASDEQSAAALTRFAQAQRGAGVDAQLLDAPAARDLEPELSSSIVSAVYYPDDAQVQPAIATEALLAAARAAGVRVLANTPVTGALRDAQGRLVGVTTPSGSIEADHVVVAAGPWSSEVAVTLGGAAYVEPRKGLLLVTSRMPQRIWHKVYDTSYVGAVQSDEHDLQTSTVIESTAAGTVLIGSSRQNVGFDESIDVGVLRVIAEKAITLMPFLRDATVIRAYGGFRPLSRDHLPIIGADPDVAGLWYATGHEGAGIGLAPGTAELLAAAMFDETPSVRIEPFVPSRPSLRRVA